MRSPSAAHGIAVNLVEPGNADTASVRAACGDEVMDKMVESAPVGQLAEPREVGDAVAFLASGGAAYMTGKTLVLDGVQTRPVGKI